MNIYEKEKKLTDYTLKALEKVKDIETYGPRDSEKITSVISFNPEIKGVYL